MKVVVDFSQVEDFEALPAGEYAVVIESIELRESKTSEHPYLNFTLEVAEGEFQGRKLWFIGSLSPKALWRLKAVFDSFGFEGEQAELETDDGSGILLSPELAGLPAVAQVSVENYNKKDRNRVDELIGAEGIARGSDVLQKKAKPAPEVAKKATVVKVVETVEEAIVEEEEEEAPRVTSARVSPFAKKGTATAQEKARKVFK